MKRCIKCVMPQVEGHVAFDEGGVCNVCNRFDETKILSKEEKQVGGYEDLIKKINKHKGDGRGKYDCAVGVSGGKDSIMALYIAKNELNLNPLAIFIDNGFSLDEMFHNIKSATDILGIDLVIYKVNKFKEIFKYLLVKKKEVYYCRVCHALLDVYVREVADRYHIKMLIGGYTKGQEFAKSEELFWIFNESDENANSEIEKSPGLKDTLDILNNLALYLYENYSHIAQVNPFQYIDYNEGNILEFLTEKLDFKRPSNSWPKDSTNCSFNFLSQHLAMKYWGYSQHETEVSTLVRKKELTRERALDIIETPIPMEILEEVLQKLDLKYEDII
ncbi:MAG: phosphoadenosine phosphosulfate reductase [Firmicutes bacterium HGW-Firmicutes-1]|nr:MAG: phosphoadenosine phosphosulfate reductase [Firmicutes bacterium HGW-Firmicutes-1]